ncbi:hypothetical protein [Marisediminicola sp. LYQ134]|uniref:hypothetical protein n=1 Tax=Marisediminicola sp. LYQ134 TaxID=3391061 RepID=UPI0039838DD2
MTTMNTDAASLARSAAVDAGEDLLARLRTHIDEVAGGSDAGEVSEETDSALWDAVAAYGDALDVLYGDDDDDDEPDDDEPDDLTFTVRTRYDYTVVDEKAFLAAGTGLGGAVHALLERAGGKPIPALEVASLETGSGLITVHLNREPLTSDDFSDADESTDLLLVDPDESLQFVLDEPVYGSRAEAEAAARRHSGD